MGKVDQKDQTDEQEKAGTNHGKVIAPNDEEGVWNEEGQDHESQPRDDLGTPESVLNGRAAVL